MKHALPGVSLLLMFAIAQAQAATPIQAQARPLDPRGHVEIENIKGSISVQAWDRPEVGIEGELGDGVEKLEIEGGRSDLKIRVKYPNRGSGLGFLVGGDNSEPSHLRLMVPLRADVSIESVAADVDVLGVASDDLSIESVSGDVKVAAAPLEATIESVSGDLTLTLNRANVHAESVSGDIRLSGRLGERLDLSTVSGDIGVEVRDTLVRRISASSVSGDMRIGTQLAPDGRIRLESVSGQVALRLPRALSAKVKAESFSGELKATSANVLRSRHGPGSSLEHRYGQAEGDVVIETFSGDIDLTLD